MNEFKAMNFETKFIAFFAISSLLIVVLTGGIAGIGITLILFRAILAVVIFSGLAYAIIFVLRKFLPEVYNILNKSTSSGAANEPPDIGESIGGEGTSGETPGAELKDEQFAEGSVDEKDRSQVSGAELSPGEAKSEEIQADLDKKSSKLGKHLVKFENLDKYEPKVMAEAVRTMMSKDEE